MRETPGCARTQGQADQPQATRPRVRYDVRMNQGTGSGSEAYYAGWLKARGDLLVASIGRFLALLAASDAGDEALRADVFAQLALWRALQQAGAPEEVPGDLSNDERFGNVGTGIWTLSSWPRSPRLGPRFKPAGAKASQTGPAHRSASSPRRSA